MVTKYNKIQQGRTKCSRYYKFRYKILLYWWQLRYINNIQKHWNDGIVVHNIISFHFWWLNQFLILFRSINLLINWLTIWALMMFWFCRPDAQTGRTSSRRGPSWTHTPAPATRRRGGRRTSWWWDTVRTSGLKANAPSGRNRYVTLS